MERGRITMKKRIVLISVNVALTIILCVGNIIMWNLPYRHFSYKQYTPYIIVNHKDKFGNPDPHYDCDCDKGAVEYLYGENLIYMKNFGASREFVSSQNSGTITENNITDGEMLKNALDNFSLPRCFSQRAISRDFSPHPLWWSLVKESA